MTSAEIKKQLNGNLLGELCYSSKLSKTDQFALCRSSRGLEGRLGELRCSGHKKPTRQSNWRLLDVFATTNRLPHRSCIACHEIMDVTGIIRSELMILAGLMIARMNDNTHLKHEVFPVCSSQSPMRDQLS